MSSVKPVIKFRDSTSHQCPLSLCLGKKSFRQTEEVLGYQSGIWRRTLLIEWIYIKTGCIRLAYVIHAGQPGNGWPRAGETGRPQSWTPQHSQLPLQAWRSPEDLLDSCLCWKAKKLGSNASRGEQQHRCTYQQGVKVGRQNASLDGWANLAIIPAVRGLLEQAG